jgi:hypothetical protein
MQAAVVTRHGGPEVIELQTLPVPRPAAGGIRRGEPLLSCSRYTVSTLITPAWPGRLNARKSLVMPSL